MRRIVNVVMTISLVKVIVVRIIRVIPPVKEAILVSRILSNRVMSVAVTLLVIIAMIVGVRDLKVLIPPLLRCARAV